MVEQHPLQQARLRLQRMSQDCFAVRRLFIERGMETATISLIEGKIENASSYVERMARGVLPIQALTGTYEVTLIGDGAALVPYPHTLRDALIDAPQRVMLRGPHETVMAHSCSPGSLYRCALRHSMRVYRVWLERSETGDFEVSVYRVDEASPE